jgi:UDP-N-acetylmuramoyl-L-alanyl-D-glutamate--2,6-diaminopimelate ligase
MRMVGVTGTSGKTTTTYLIRAILEAAGLQPGLIGTVEYRVGTAVRPSENSTPEAHVLQGLLREMADAGCGAAVLEATSHGLVLDRMRGISFEAAVFTNLSRDHLDFHPSLDAYRAAKATLFENLDAGAHAILNTDDPSWREMARRSRARVTTYGTSPGADVRIAAGETDYRGTQMTLTTASLKIPVTLALTGGFNMLNAAAAAATGLAMGIPEEAIAPAMRDVRVPGRFEPVAAGQPFGVFVDYAHKPDALENVLKAARPLARKGARVISLFGCGGDRDRGKRPEMGRISAEFADLTVVTSDNPRTETPEDIVSQIIPGVGKAPHVIEVDRRKAIAAALAEAREGDVVVIAGKGHEDYQIVGRTKNHFDDREEAMAALKGLGYGK